MYMHHNKQSINKSIIQLINQPLWNDQYSNDWLGQIPYTMTVTVVVRVFGWKSYRASSVSWLFIHHFHKYVWETLLSLTWLQDIPNISGFTGSVHDGYRIPVKTDYLSFCNIIPISPAGVFVSKLVEYSRSYPPKLLSHE